MGVVSWAIFIYLSRSGTIGQDEVEVKTVTFSCIVFEADELEVFSILNSLS
jgi:hypothetical protein